MRESIAILIFLALFIAYLAFFARPNRLMHEIKKECSRDGGQLYRSLENDWVCVTK